jgi:AbrB family looped-hinge helix DNA binding protein
MPRTRLDTDSRVAIPDELSAKLGVQPGDELDVEWGENEIVIRRPGETALDRLLALGGEMWRGAAEQVDRDRDTWDR